MRSHWPAGRPARLTTGRELDAELDQVWAIAGSSPPDDDRHVPKYERTTTTTT